MTINLIILYDVNYLTNYKVIYAIYFDINNIA